MRCLRMAELLHKAAESVVAKLEQSAAQLQVLSVMLHHFSCAASHHNECAPVQSCPIRTSFLTLIHDLDLRIQASSHRARMRWKEEACGFPMVSSVVCIVTIVSCLGLSWLAQCELSR